MNLTQLSRRGLAATATSALVVGGTLAAVPAAQAAPATNVYTCGNAVVGPYDVTVTTDVPMLPPSTAAGLDVPAALLDMTNRVTIPPQAYQTFTSSGVTRVDMTDYQLTIDTTKVGAQSLVVAPSAFTRDTSGTYSADVNGKNAPFEVPAAGTHPVTAPSAFTLVATLGNGTQVPLACNIRTGTTPTSLGNVTVAKNDATMTGKARRTTAGKPARVKVKVIAANEVPTGKVIAKIGKQRVGKAKLNLAGRTVVKIRPRFLDPGVNKVKLSYAGDGYTESARDRVKVRVVK